MSKTNSFLTRIIGRSLVAIPLGLSPVFLGQALEGAGITGFVSKAYAQDEEEQAAPKYKTKKTYSLRQNVFKDFADVQEATDANEWPTALEVLKKLESSKAEKYTSYEKANLYNYFGWVYYSLENYDEAIRYYKMLLEEEELSEALELGTLYTLAQLLFVQEDYKGAVGYLERWMELQPIKGSDAYVLLAQGYYQLGDMDKAMENIDIAVEQYESKDKVPKENWYSLQRAVYYEKGDNQTVIEILIKMIRHYPKTTYWKQLAGLYGAVEEESKQLYSMETVYLMGGLSDEKELLNLAYLYLGKEVPYKSAKVLEKGIESGQIEKTSKNLETLATAWRLAQNVKKSIPYMEQAASKAEDGNLYARLAGVYLDSDQNEKAIEAGTQANKRGKIKRPDQLQIVLGMANVNLRNYDAAIEAFEKAAKDERSKKFALQWIDFAKNEKQREDALKS